MTSRTTRRRATPSSLGPRARARLAAACAAALCALPAARAHATPTARPPHKRPVPRYDGRGPPPTDATDVAYAVPRALLWPFAELIAAVRLPVRWLLSTQAAYDGIGAVLGVNYDESASNAPRPSFGMAFYPEVVFDLGRRFHAGAAVELALAPRAAGPASRLLLSGATGGSRFWSAELWDRVAVHRGLEIGPRLSYLERPDNIEAGPPGPNSSTFDVTHFWARHVFAGATAGLTFSPLLLAFFSTGVRWIEYDLDHPVWLQQTPYAAQNALGAFVADAELRLDTRPPASRPMPGVQALARLHYGSGFADTSEQQWFSAEALVGGYLEVLHPGRILGLELFAADAEAMRAAPVPFTELPTLGGDTMVRGFLEGRIRGPSVLAASVLYEWPLWIFFEAALRVGVGGAFGPHFTGFDPGAFAGSFSFALQSPPRSALQLQLLFGLGSTPFGAPNFHVDSVRVLISLARTF